MYPLLPHQSMMLVINSIALCLGAPGNILILRVYFSKPRKTSTHILIMGLALSDLISLFFTFPLEVVSWIYEYHMVDGEDLCRLVSFCYHYFAQCSVLITVAIAIDRYNAVCRPHQWKFTSGRAQGVLVGCFLLSTLTSIAGAFSYGVKSLETNASFFDVESTDLNSTVVVTMCHRDVASGFNRFIFVLHAMWFAILFIVLIMAYLRIYLTIRKRVNTSVGAQQDDENAHMRSVRPVIRFISHLTVATNRVGGVAERPTKSPQTDDGKEDKAIAKEPTTYSTDVAEPNSPVAVTPPTPEKTTSPWVPDDRPGPLIVVGKSTPAVPRTVLPNRRPVLPSIGHTKTMNHAGLGQLKGAYGNDNKDPKKGDQMQREAEKDPGQSTGVDYESKNVKEVASKKGPVSTATNQIKNASDESLPNDRPNKRMSTAWNKIMSKAVVGEAGNQQGVTPRVGFKIPSSNTDGPAGGTKPIVPVPIAKVLQKRAAATAMNLKMQKKTTNMLLVAALTAVLTWLPTLVIEVSLPNVHEWLIIRPVWLQMFTCFMGWLFLFNFVTNPFVYSLMNSRFREDCGKSIPLLKCCNQQTDAST